MSLPQSVSPSPIPSTSGEAFLATTSRSGCRARRDRDGVRAVHLLERLANRIEKSWCTGAERAIDEVRDDLGVGVRREVNAVCFESLPQGNVVLDDAVVHDRDVTGRVRVSVVLARSAVGRPSRVADAGGARQGSLGERLVEACELADRAYHFDGLAIVHREPGRIVASVFEPSQAVDQDGGGLARPNVSDDSAHGPILRPRRPRDNFPADLRQRPDRRLDPSRKALTWFHG